MGQLPIKLRRSISIFCPIATIVVLLGFTNGFAKVDEKLLQTPLTLGLILVALNLALLFLAAKHQVP